MRRLKALIIKEFHQIIRDPSSILITIVLPAILLFIYGYGVSLDYKHLKIGLVMEDTTPDAQSFAKSLTHSIYFDVDISSTRKAFESKISDGTLKGIVVIPSYFSTFRQNPSQIAPIQVIADGINPNTASFVQNYVAAAFQNWLIQESISSDWPKSLRISPEIRFWFNESLDSRHFLLPGSLAIIMTLIGTLLTSLVIAREWERGTMEALMATPVTIIEIVFGKLISYFVLGMISFILSTFLTIFLFNVPFRGSFFILCITAGVFLLTALGLGLLISTLCKNQFTASQAALNAAFLPAFMLSGFVFEIASMPYPIRLITYLMPAKYFVSCLQTLFLAGNIRSLIIYNKMEMLLIELILYAITAKKTVKRLDG